MFLHCPEVDVSELYVPKILRVTREQGLVRKPIARTTFRFRVRVCSERGVTLNRIPPLRHPRGCATLGKRIPPDIVYPRVALPTLVQRIPPRISYTRVKYPPRVSYPKGTRRPTICLLIAKANNACFFSYDDNYVIKGNKRL